MGVVGCRVLRRFSEPWKQASPCTTRRTSHGGCCRGGARSRWRVSHFCQGAMRCSSVQTMLSPRWRKFAGSRRAGDPTRKKLLHLRELVSCPHPHSTLLSTSFCTYHFRPIFACQPTSGPLTLFLAFAAGKPPPVGEGQEQQRGPGPCCTPMPAITLGDDVPDRIRDELFDHQREGIQFTLRCFCGEIVDDSIRECHPLY